jgi:toxin ParE1/3/4
MTCPRIGQVAPEVGDDSVRELSLYSYRIIYEITGRDVQVLAGCINGEI